MQKSQDKVEIFTDGACKGNPGPGGLGIVMRFKENTKEYYEAHKNTTNNRMELMAAIKALSMLKRPCTVILHSDSQYLSKGVTEWLEKWKKNNWKTSSKKDVKNKDLWQKLDEFTNIHTIDWKWVKGHAGHKENERCDALANIAIDTM